MSFQQFGDVRIFRPSQEAENFVRDQTRPHLLSRFSPGEYRGAEAVNAIIQHQMQRYDELLRPLIPKLAADNGVSFLLFQFDEACRILHGDGILDLRERERWMWIEPHLKRALKFLVELVCMEERTPQRVRDSKQASLVTELALVCAESLTDLAHHSDLAHSVFPNDCVIRVFDSGSLDFKFHIEGKHAGYDREFLDRVTRDRNFRKQFVGSPQFDNQTALHQRYLDQAFTESFGMSYGEFIYTIMAVIDGCQPALHPNAFPALFVHRGRVFEEVAKSGWSRTGIERALDGFSITQTKLKSEGRVVWKPKQENRAYRRGFYVLPHESGPHLAFSKAMARENLVQLVTGACYKRLPEEWRTQATSAALQNLSQAAGEWFEDVVRRNLSSLGIIGMRMQNRVGTGKDQIEIPASVGELDFLGYHGHQQLLVLVESKMVLSGLEARYWRDDLDEFVHRSGSYAEKFRRKISWVKENREALSAALGIGQIASVGVAMLTLYPNIARAFVSDFPCVSLTEFMLDYERKKEWPYPIS